MLPPFASSTSFATSSRLRLEISTIASSKVSIYAIDQSVRTLCERIFGQSRTGQNRPVLGFFGDQECIIKLFPSSGEGPEEKIAEKGEDFAVNV